MLPRSHGRQMRTSALHRAHANPRASAADTAPASRGLYTARGARDPLRGYRSIAPPRPVTRRPGLHSRASTLSTRALLATPSCVEAIRSGVTSGGSLLASTPLAFLASV